MNLSTQQDEPTLTTSGDPQDFELGRTPSEQGEDSDTESDDPISKFVVPKAVLDHNPQLVTEVAAFETQIQHMSRCALELVGNDDEKVRHYVEGRANLADAATLLAKKCRASVNELAEQGKLAAGQVASARKELEKSEVAVLEERIVLAKNRKRLEFAILRYGVGWTIGEAYLASISGNPSASSDPDSFATRLRKTYNPPDCESHYMVWCPITGRSYADDYVTYTHIVPSGLGNHNAAYLFGLHPEKGFEAIWGTGNGLLLYKELSDAFEAFQFVIIPAGGAPAELEVFILDESLLEKRFGPYRESCFRDINHRRLQFHTDARPHRRFLYLHCLLSLLWRRRLNAKGWAAEIHRVMAGSALWGTPEQWLRRSMTKALAYEIGDVEVLNEDFLADFSDKVGSEKEAQIAVEIRYAVERESSS